MTVSQGSWRIRGFEPADLDRLITIIRTHLETDAERHIGPWQRSEQMMRRALVREAEGVSVVEAAGEIVALLWTTQRGGEMWVEELHVVAVARGSGLGRQLMAMAEGKARRCGCDELRLTAFTDSPAIGFYERLGFIVVQSRPLRNQWVLAKPVSDA